MHRQNLTEDSVDIGPRPLGHVPINISICMYMLRRLFRWGLQGASPWILHYVFLTWYTDFEGEVVPCAVVERCTCRL